MNIQSTPAAASSSLPSTLLDALRRNAAAQGGVGSVASAPAAASASFGGALDQALRAVSASQQQASQMAQAVIRDPARTSLEETMVATQSAQIGFQSALHVRNRLVSAYSDIMNMQV